MSEYRSYMSDLSTSSRRTCFNSRDMNDDEMQDHFGKWLASQMEERNLSGEALGRMTGWSGSAVRSWLKGTRTPEERACDAIAEAFGIDRNEVRRRAGRGLVHQGSASAQQGQQASTRADRATVYTYVQNDPDLTDFQKRIIFEALDDAERRRREIEAAENQ